MPATVVCLSGLPNTHARAMAMNPTRLAGRISEEGTPFSKEQEARNCARCRLAARTSWIAARLTKIPLEGHRPRFESPLSLPEFGQVVYVLDQEAEEVLEVTVGWTGLDFGTWQAGYDSSPGNPEANMVIIREWWSSKECALWGARNRHHKEFAFVSKEEAAKRVDASIEKVWSDAAARLRDPEWNRRNNEAMKSFIEAVRARTPVAAG